MPTDPLHRLSQKARRICTALHATRKAGDWPAFRRFCREGDKVGEKIETMLKGAEEALEAQDG